MARGMWNSQKCKRASRDIGEAREGNPINKIGALEMEVKEYPKIQKLRL